MEKGHLIGDSLVPVLREMVSEHLNRMLPGMVRSVFRLGQQDFQAPIFLAKANAAIAQGSSGAASIYGVLGDTTGSETELGEDNDVTVYLRNGTVSSGDWIYVLPCVSSGAFEVLQTAGGCIAQNAILDITVLGSPTGGTFDIDLTVNSSEETLTFNYNDAAAAVDTELDTHTEIANGDVSVVGGPFPDATIRIEFKANLAETDIEIPTADWGSLTGGSGVGVVCALAQLGISA